MDQTGSEPALETRFVDPGGVDLRARTARGTLITAGFLVVVNGLQLVKGVAVASFLTTSQYGTWGLLLAAFLTVMTFGAVGVDDKYIQQDDPDQVRAFEVAFTMQTLLAGVLIVAMLIGIPAFALLYGHTSMIAPGLALAAAVPATVLQMPLWVHYRRMNFGRQRLLQAIDPVVSLVAVLSLAAAGLGLWALVCGELIGTWCAAVVAFRSSPYRARFRWERQALRDYTSFSWPLFVSATCTVLWIQVPVTVSSRLLGVAAVAGIALAANIAQFTTQVDNVVTQSLYPAICAVKDQAHLLFESFWKSNQLALLWATPLGAAAALFAADFIHYVIGEKWHFALPLIIAFGINAVLNQIGFNWTAFFRAIGDTRPIGVTMVVQLIAMLTIGIPLLIVDGLVGFGIGMCAATTVAVALRLWYLKRIFPSLGFISHIVRGIGPTLPGVAAVLLVRLADPGPRSPLRVLAEAFMFSVVVIATTLVFQRPLLTESFGYLRGRSPFATATPEPPAGTVRTGSMG